MKHLIIIWICTLVPVLSIAQHTKSKKDSLKNIIQVTPYLTLTGTNSSFSKTITDSSILRFSSGISLFNTLRGQVPNLNLSHYALDNKAAGMRSHQYNSSIVLDGIPYFENLPDYLPLNAFDYNSVSVVSNSSMLSTLTDNPSTGVVLLQSKSGKDILKPTVEVNSYTNYDYDRSANSSTKDYNLNFANSIAFMEDFGAVDTRISFTHLDTKMNLNGASINLPDKYQIHVNTGIEVHEKIQMRLLLHNNMIRSNYTLPAYFNQSETNINLNQNFFSGNYFTQFQITNWLTAQAQYNFSQISYRQTQKSNLHKTAAEKLNNLNTGNLSIRVKKDFNKWSFSSFGGILLTDISNDRSMVIDFNHTSYRRQTKSTGFISGAEIGVHDIWYAHTQYRINRYSSIENDTKSNYSVGTSLQFSKWLNSDFLSSGKLRSNYSTQYIIPFQEFPSIDSFTSPIRYEENSFVEIGADLSFLKSRLDFTFNYFNISPTKKDNLEIIDPTTGFSITYINVGKIRKNGLEFIITGRPVISDKILYEISGIWSNHHVLISDTNNSSNGNLIAGNPYPDWRGSLLNKVIWNNLVLNFLVEGSKGGNIISSSSSGGITVYDASYIVLRDVSIGYQLSNNFNSKLKLTKSWVSMSLRNFATSTKEISTNAFFAPKSISANFYLVF